MKTIDYIALTLVLSVPSTGDDLDFLVLTSSLLSAAQCPFYPGSYMLLSVSVVFMRSVFVEG